MIKNNWTLLILFIVFVIATVGFIVNFEYNEPETVVVEVKFVELEKEVLNNKMLNLPVEENNNRVDFRDYAIERFMSENAKGVEWHPNLSEDDKATYKQAADRIDSLIYWSKEFNSMFPEIQYQRLVKDAMEIMLHESYGVNWSSRTDENGNRHGVLDEGEAFGIWSMLFDTAEWIAEVNDWDYVEEELMSDTHLQTRYAVWYLYWLLDFMDNRASNEGVELSVDELRYAMIDGYNLPSIDPTKPRKRSYYHVVINRIIEADYLINEKVNAYYDWNERQEVRLERIKG